MQAGTTLEIDGQMMKAGELARTDESLQFEKVKAKKDKNVEYRTKLTVHWGVGEEESWILATNVELAESVSTYVKRYWIEEMFSDHKSRGLNLEKTCITEANRLQRLLVAMTLAYLWIMEIGFSVVTRGKTKKVDNRGASRSVNLCRIGLRRLRELQNNGQFPPLFTINFGAMEKT